MAARSPVCSKDAHDDKEIRAQSNLRRHSQLCYFCLLFMVLDICLFSFTCKNSVNKRLPRVAKV